MKKEWFLEQTPWEIAEQQIEEKKLGKVVEVCIQVIQRPGSNAGALKDTADEWLSLLARRFGRINSESRLERHLTLSAIARFDEGAIARVFIDASPMGLTGSLDFEVIGTRASLIYRSNKGLGCYYTALSGGGFAGETMSTDISASDLRRIQKGSGKILRLGVIGLDHPHAAGNHFPALDQIQDAVRVAAIAHPSQKDSKKWLDHFQAKYYPSRDELLSDREVEAVLITSKNCDHAADAISAANAGKDVFCDKPIATSLDQTLSIVKACEKNHVRFVTTYPLRYHPAIVELKAKIARGDFGEIQAAMATNHGCMYEPGAPAWVKDPLQNGGGCIIDHTVHVADIIRFLTGKEFVNIRTFAESAWSGIKAEDIAVCHGEMTGGTIYQIDCSWSRKPTDPPWGDVTMRIIGEKGSASFDLYNNYKIELFSPTGIEYRYSNSLTHQHGMIFLDYRKEKIAGVRSVNADEIDGLRTMELVFASYESQRQDKDVKLDLHHFPA